MRKVITLLLFLAFSGSSFAQKTIKSDRKNSRLHLYGMYLQWGYNEEWYTKSNIHFRLSNGDRFTLHHAKAHQRTSFSAIKRKPLEISIPQYNYRLGFYLNEKHSKIFEINFDHAKYIVTDGQSVRVTGTIGGQQVDENKIIDAQTFLHFEHSDGANWLHLNYAEQHPLLHSSKAGRDILTYIWKAGAGINIPRTDFTYEGDRLNNKFHIAGFNFGAEAGARVYPLKFLFFELTGKTGFVDYLNALANTTTLKGNRANHTFGYFEVIGTFGVDIKF